MRTLAAHAIASLAMPLCWCGLHGCWLYVWIWRLAFLVAPASEWAPEVPHG
jgi:hypothetical protein